MKRKDLTAHDFMVLLWSAPDWMSAQQLRAVVLKAMGYDVAKKRKRKEAPVALALTLTLTACGPHIDTPLPPRSDSAENAPQPPQAKPAPPLRLHGQPAPGPVWQNPDGTFGALKGGAK